MLTTTQTLTNEEKIAILEAEIEKLSGHPQFADEIQALQEEVWILEFS